MNVKLLRIYSYLIFWPNTQDILKIYIFFYSLYMRLFSTMIKIHNWQSESSLSHLWDLTTCDLNVQAAKDSWGVHIHEILMGCDHNWNTEKATKPIFGTPSKFHVNQITIIHKRAKFLTVFFFIERMNAIRYFTTIDYRKRSFVSGIMTLLI